VISKGKRFEIFKRDGFTCQYCGRRPPEVVLEVDHVEPQSLGGSDEEINLVSSCFDCNRGKSAKRLGDVHPRPDADLEFLRVQQELAEAARYLAASKILDNAKKRVVKRLKEVWVECFGCDLAPSKTQWSRWLAANSPDEIEYAIRRTGPRFLSGQFGFHDEATAVREGIRYVSGIMRSRAKERTEKAEA
jgi:hypothetical protein